MNFFCSRKALKVKQAFFTFYYSSFNSGVPAAAEITGLPGETKDVEITLKWKEAENNGAPIDKYTVYRRTVREDGTSLIWIKLNEIKDTSNREVVVNVEKGKVYEFVVTATNEFGEGGKEEGQIRKIKVLGGKCRVLWPGYLNSFFTDSLYTFK